MGTISNALGRAVEHSETPGLSARPDTVALLRRLLVPSPVRWDRGGYCIYCHATFDQGNDHYPDCPYVEAITLFGDPNATPPQGEISP